MREIEGTHLIVDAYVKDSATLGEKNMLQLFDRLVEELDMVYLQRPMKVDVPIDTSKLDSTEDEGGSSYYCLITTSHIAAHTWELRRAVMLDVFSCKPFNTTRALVLLDEHLNFAQHRKVIVQRLDPKTGGSTYFQQVELDLPHQNCEGI